MSWNNNTISAPNWAGNVANNKSKILQVSSIYADQIVTKELYAFEKVLAENLETGSVSSVNGSIAFLSNLVLNTGVIALGVTPTYLTAQNGILYVNGDAVGFPSSFSTIADWSQFKAVADVDMSRSSIYNVHSISTNTISTGILLSKDITTNGLSTLNISSANITFDTLNGRAGTTQTLSGSNLVYCNATFSNLNAVNTFVNRFSASTILSSNSISAKSISSINISTSLINARTITTSNVIASNIASFNISTINLSSRNISNVELITLSPNVLSGIWDNTRVYSPGDKVLVSGTWYVALLSNFNVPPAVNLPLWTARDWYFGEAAFVTGLGSYICISNNSYTTPPNGHEDAWTFLGDVNSFNYMWNGFTTPPTGLKSGTIVGNDLSFIQVGTLSSIYLNASNINVNNLNIDTLNISSFSTLSINVSTLNTDTISSGIINLSNLTSYNITNSNSISNAGNFSNTGNFSNAGDANINTLTTHGQVYTQNILNVQGLMSLQSDVYGEVNNITLDVPPFTTSKQYLKDINDIRTGNFQTVNIVGGSTGNTILPDYYEYSELNVGETETTPAIVTLYGVNINPLDPLTNLTTALTVYGDTSLYGNTSFYPLNGSLTAYKAYGNTYTYGTATVDGLFTAAGAAVVEGILTTLGNANVGGVATVTGIGTFLGGIAITGLFSAQNSEINFNNQVGGSSYTFTNWGITNLKNGLTLNGDGTATNNFNVNGSLAVGGNEVVDGNLTVNGLIFGTVVSGSETVSTLNVSTIRAFNISSITNTTQEFFVSSIAGYSNRIIEFNNEIRVPKISTIRIIADNISTNSILADNISTTNLNMINGTGNQLLLQSYGEQGPVLGFSRTIDGVDFLDGAIASADSVGFIMAGFSTISITANDDYKVECGESIRLLAHDNVYVSGSNLIVNSNALINEISTGVLLAGSVGVTDLLISVSSIMQDIRLYSDSPNNVRSGIYGDLLSYVSTGYGTFNNLNVMTGATIPILTVETIQSNPAGSENITISATQNVNITGNVDTLITGIENITVNSSNINFNASQNINSTGNWNYTNYNLDNIHTSISLSTVTSSVTIKGELPAVFFYTPNDQETPTGFITAQENNGLILATPTSSITLLAAENIGLQATSNIALTAVENVFIQGNLLTVDTQANISSITTNYIQASNLSTTSLIVDNITAQNTTTSNLNAQYISTGFIQGGSVGIAGQTDLALASQGRFDIASLGSMFINTDQNLQVISQSNITITSLSNLDITTFYTANHSAETYSLNAGLANITASNINLTTSNNGFTRINNLIAPNISTNFLSTGSLFVNNSVENSISSLRISTGSLFSGVISSIQFNASSINANRAFITNLTGSGSATLTTNLYPQSAGSQLGYGSNTAQGGFYGFGTFRSTITQVIQGSLDNNSFSNVVRVQGNLSSQNTMVSSINNKLYPYTSTLNLPFSSFSITGNQAGTPILLYSNVDFRNQGFHRISQKTILSKNSGGTSADIHGNIFYTVGAFPSTPSITDGYSALPSVNQDNASTFTTLMTEFYVSTPTTRNILYYDATANNYTARLYMGTLFDSYTPQFGFNPERIPANIL